MVDLNELRLLVQDYKLAGSPVFVQVADMNELLDRIETAEKECAALRTESAGLVDDMNLLRDNNTALRARIEAMERQEPVAWLHETRRDSDVVTDAVKHVWGKAAVGSMAAYSMPLYLAPGAQPAPSIPEGWKLVPVEVVDLYSFMCAAFVPMTPQQEQIALQLDLAKQAMLAAAPEAKP